MKSYDGRVKEVTDKCKDCKWFERWDKFTGVCVHPIWKETQWGCSERKGLSTTACLRFEKR